MIFGWQIWVIFADKKDDAVGCTEENFVEKECVTKEIPVTLNLECEAMKEKRAKEPNQIPYEESVKVLKDQKLQLHDLTVEKIKVSSIVK